MAEPRAHSSNNPHHYLWNLAPPMAKPHVLSAHPIFPPIAPPLLTISSFSSLAPPLQSFHPPLQARTHGFFTSLGFSMETGEPHLLSYSDFPSTSTTWHKSLLPLFQRRDDATATSHLHFHLFCVSVPSTCAWLAHPKQLM